MPEREIDSAFSAEIGYPIPGEYAFNPDYDVFPEGVRYELKVVRGTLHVFVEYGFTTIIDDADVHGPCMKVDSDVELMLVLIESH